MKKILSFLAIFGVITILFAQDKNDGQRKNDLMIDPIILIAVPAINATYERLLNNDSGIGINAIIELDNEGRDFTQFSPFYRMYFGKKYASGFFAEAFIPITSTNDGVYYEYDYINGTYYSSGEEIKKTTVGFGVGFGGKWVIKKNIVFEASIGIGRRFGLNDKDRNYYYISEVEPKGMLGIGYRF